jgi:hypothetical protein
MQRGTSGRCKCTSTLTTYVIRRRYLTSRRNHGASRTGFTFVVICHAHLKALRHSGLSAESCHMILIPPLRLSLRVWQAQRSPGPKGAQQPQHFCSVRKVSIVAHPRQGKENLLPNDNAQQVLGQAGRAFKIGCRLSTPLDYFLTRKGKPSHGSNKIGTLGPTILSRPSPSRRNTPQLGR